jgi:hypothetical protein
MANRPTSQRRTHRVAGAYHAIDLEPAVVGRPSSRQSALSLKRSARRHKRRKAPSLQSTLSTLTARINRAGKNLNAARRRVFNAARAELRRVFDRT